MPDLIPSGQTTVVGSGELRSFSDVANAGTIQNAGTTIDAEPIDTVIASGVGRGVGSATTNRVTNPTASGNALGIGAATTDNFTNAIASGVGKAFGRAVSKNLSVQLASGVGRGVGSASAITADYIRSGETFTIPSGGQTGFDDAQNAGTITNAGTSVDVQQPASVSATGIGNGIGQATTDLPRRSSANGAGLGVGNAIAEPQTESVATGIGKGLGAAGIAKGVSASGVGRGIGAAIESPFQELAASGIGTGFGTGRNPLPFDPIQQIIRLIENTDNSRWRTDKPDRIDSIWEYSHNDRINFTGSAFYIYTPTDSVVDKFGIEGDSLNQTITIEILIMTLSPSETQGYVNDTAKFISQLYNDNTVNSGLFHRFGSISAADLRNEHITQQTDHYIASISFEIQRFSDIEPLESVGDFI
jgi:hypothetical protein